MDSNFVEAITQFITAKIPLIAHTEMSIVSINENTCVIKIPLLDKNKNHLNSMYFGALAIGADCAGGLMSLYHMMQLGLNLSIAFKDFKANFLRRPEHDVYFRCHDGLLTKTKILEAVETKQRISCPVYVEAYTLEDEQEVLVADFTLTLSIK